MATEYSHQKECVDMTKRMTDDLRARLARNRRRKARKIKARALNKETKLLAAAAAAAEKDITSRAAPDWRSITLDLNVLKPVRRAVPGHIPAVNKFLWG
jgi:hypothetical protein